jgi:hypothetical protein
MRSIGVVALALAGCSLIYNPNNLPDPRVIDAAVVDANPCALELVSIAPTVIQEGQGVDGSPPALLVVRGNNIVANNLKVAVTAKDGAAVHLDPITDPMVSGDTTYVAFTVSAPIDGALGNPASTLALDVTVTQDAPLDGSCMFAASRTLSDQLTYRALPELTAAPLTPSLYSRIQLPALNITPVQDAPRIELNAVSSITIGNVNASASGAIGGPGGFSATGNSGPGAGQPGDPATGTGVGGGGGGGGFAAMGIRGANATGNGGAGGPPVGQGAILTYDDNRASAGAAGGKGLSVLGGFDGGPGGGGGGAIVLVAGGDITAEALSAVGAPGGAGAGSALLGSGGGGGGAGGAVVVRSAAGKLAVGTIHVAGGAGGTPAPGGAGGGGAGSVGRVRWDSPVDGAPSSPDTAAHRGPSFTGVTRVVTTSEPTFMLSGTSGDEIDVRAIDSRDVPHPGPHVSFNSSGIATIRPTLSPGFNQLCVKLAGGSENQPAANTCITVAYLPPRP